MKVENKNIEYLKVNSEVGQLQKVLIHRPDHGIEEITPDSAVELLYEDIVYLPKMIEEHDEFTETIRYFIGKENVLEFESLLKEILDSNETRHALLTEIKKIERLSEKQLSFLINLDSNTLSSILISGYRQDTNEKYFNPLPNLIFTRDIGVMINDHLLISNAALNPRKRESILSKYLFRNHSLFRNLLGENKIILFDEKEDSISIEGGDIMMLSNGHLIVATSERTTEKALDRLSEILFQKNVIKKITRVALPTNRYCMHLDTIFTKFDKNTYIGYQPLIATNLAKVVQYNKTGRQSFESLEHALRADNKEVQFFYSGEGKQPFAEREQWTDACNLFAIKEGVAFTYDRNYKTNIALQKQGYSLISAKDLMQEFKEGKTNPHEVSKTIITIPSSELSRARGGPHCMTMPLIRI